MTNEELRDAKKEYVKEGYDRWHGIIKEMKMLDEMHYLSFDVKEKAMQWYKSELDAIYANTWLYDKIKGIETGGIV